MDQTALTPSLGLPPLLPYRCASCYSTIPGLVQPSDRQVIGGPSHLGVTGPALVKDSAVRHSSVATIG